MQKDTNYMEQLPRAAVEIRGGKVTALNRAASACLPGLAAGAPVPDCLAPVLAQDGTAGSFQEAGETFLYSRITGPDSDLILFCPSRDTALTGGQLEAFARKMRQQLGELGNLLDAASRSGAGESGAGLDRAGRSFYQMLHLVSDLEFLNIPEERAAQLFRPVTMDAAGLCRQLVRQTAPMLRMAEVELTFADSCPGLLIPGDPELLRRMLLALISNAAKAARGGSVTLDVRRMEDRAVITLTDCAQGRTPDLSLLSAEPQRESIPQPQDGAGMGLAIVRRIVALHKGCLLTQPAHEGLTLVVSLPTGPLEPGLPLHSPTPEEDGGYSPILVGLADILPSELFSAEE